MVDNKKLVKNKAFLPFILADNQFLAFNLYFYLRLETLNDTLVQTNFPFFGIQSPIVTLDISKLIFYLDCLTDVYCLAFSFLWFQSC